MGMLHGLRLFTEAALFLLLELGAVDGQSDPSHWSVPRVAWKYFIMTRHARTRPTLTLKASTIPWTTWKGPSYCMARLVFLSSRTEVLEEPGYTMKLLLLPVIDLRNDGWQLNIFKNSFTFPTLVRDR